MSSRKVTGLPLPETPKEAPPEFHGLVDAIEDRLAESDTLGGVSALACAFEYLTRYFASVAGAACLALELGGTTEVAADFEEARSQLKERLLLLGEKSTDPLSKLIRSIFYVGATRKTPTPRRHARLLDLGGIPIRGYLSLGEWIALESGCPELSSDSKANRELLRYLPILKEWVTAAATYFLDVEQGTLAPASESSVQFSVRFPGSTQQAGPVAVTEDVLALLRPHMESGVAKPSAPPQESTPQKTTEQEAAPAEQPDATPRTAYSEPPKIEVVGVESKPGPVEPVRPESQIEPDEEESSPLPPVGPSPSIPGAEPSVEVKAVKPPVQGESLTPVSHAMKSTDVPDSLALPDPTSKSEGPPAQKSVDVPRADLSSPTEAESSESVDVTEKLSVQVPPTVPDQIEPEPVGELRVPETPKPEPMPPEAALPDAKELKDPVVAALHQPKPKKKVEPPPPLVLYPMVEGPPPEFFEEVDVESDYPELLTTAITDLNGAIESNDSRLICGQLQRSLDIMIQFFAGLAGAILFEIDEEALFDFDIEDGRFDLEIKIDLIVTALSALEEFWEGNDSANLIWSVFYDTLLPATDPNCAYLHTRLLGVEGLVPDPFIEFSELCEMVPGQGKLASQQECREVAHRYLPILSFWLENAMPLFLECEVDFVEEDDGMALSWAATLAGATLDGTPSGLWLEVSPERWNLPRPELAPVFVSGDAPEVLLPVFDELNGALENADFAKAGLYCRVALDFMIQYFAGCAASLWRQQGAMTDQALQLFYPEASLAEKERLLLLSLGGISSESEVGSNLNKLFSKSSLQYRVLSQRGQPSGMKSISQWASARDVVAESELIVYLPLLRSWIGAANPWFSAGEQLFEEPAEDGVLEGVVAYGEDFLEMVDPEYVIQLARECLELVAPFDEAQQEEEKEEGLKADTPFTGKLPQLPILTEGPPVLVGHVGRLLESANDRRTSNAWLGSALEYLIQYFAGMCTSVLGGQSAPIDRTALSHFGPTASLRQREVLLVECIEYLKKAATGDVQETVRDIFLKPDGSPRLHTKYLGILGAGSLGENEMLLSFWCRTRHQAGHLSTADLHFGISVLNSWLDASKPFFSSCEHYAEDPGPDGQEEMVVELADDYLDMVLPDYAIQLPARGYYEILYRESDSEAVADVEGFFPEDVRPELLGPQDVVLGGAAGEGGEELLGAAGDLGGDDFFAGAPAAGYDSDDLFAGSSASTTKLDVDGMFAGPAEAEPAKDAATPAKSEKEQEPKAEKVKADAPPEKRKRKKKKKSRKQELGSAVLELYKKERLEKARKRAEARARKAEEAATVLRHTLDYRGLKNSKQLGGRAHFGVIELSNVGGGELKGTVEPAHPCVRVQPTRFEGNQVRVVYQVDPSDMPSTGRPGLTINTQDERVVIRLDRLVPTSWWRERSTGEAMGLLAAPSAVYAIWLLMLMGVLLGPSLEREFMIFGKSTLQSKISWGVHFKAWFFAMLAILPGASGIPAALKWGFAKLDYTTQEECRWSLIPFMMLPSAVMLALMSLTNMWVFDIPPAKLPPLASRLVITVFTFGLNLLATSLFSLQTTMWWEERQDSDLAKKYFLGFWVLTVILGVVVPFFLR